MKIKTPEATDAQIRAWARLQNIPFDGRASGNTLLAKIKEAAGGTLPEEFEIPDDFLSAPLDMTGGHKPMRGDDMPYVIIEILATAVEKEPVPVALNGRMMLIPRGRPVTISREYFNVLRDARQEIYAEYEGPKPGTFDDEGGGLGEAMIVQAYPYSVLGYAA